MGTQRVFIDTEHIEFERWGPPLVDADWHALCQSIYKGIEGKEWEEVCCHHREVSKATGAAKPSGSEKAKALQAMKGAWDRGADYYDPARKEDFLGGRKTRLDLWEEHLKDQIVALAKALRCVENPILGLAFGFTILSLPALSSSSCWNVPGKYGPHSEHLLAAEGEAGSSGRQSPDLGDMCRYGCPESPDWDGDVESGTDSDGTFASSEQGLCSCWRSQCCW